MSRLSACYFCGSPVDETGEPPEILEEAFDVEPDERIRIDLCGSCARKLEPVIEYIAEAAHGHSDRDAPVEGGPATGATGSSSKDGGTDEREARAAPADPNGETATDGPAAQPSGGGAGSPGESACDAGPEAASGVSPDAAVTGSVSALEYNKVMRLLRNREFPVDRSEIEAVATSAYDIPASAFDGVVDAAIDRGMLAEDEDGRLVRPDRSSGDGP